MPYITKEEVKEKRNAIKKAFPEFKFSITRDNCSGIRIAIMEGPEWFAKDGFHKSMNGWTKVMGTPEADAVVNKVYDIANGGNGTEVEDGDYGRVPNFYVWLSVGKWDKGYTVKGKKTGEKKEEIEVVVLSDINCEEMSSEQFEEKANEVINEENTTAPEMSFASVFSGMGERKEIETEGMILHKHLETAIRAHNGTSFSPERRGKQYIRDYSKLLEEDLEEVEKFGGDVVRYREKFERLFVDWMHSKGNCISSMIAGPSKFPTRYAEKRNNWERNKANALEDWRQRAMNAIKRDFRKAHAPDPLEAAKRKLKKESAMLERMKAANKIVKSKRLSEEEKVTRLMEDMQFSEGNARSLLRPDFCNRIGFASFQLTNCRNRMKGTQKRIEELERRANTEAKEEERADGIRIVENAEENRLQVFFPGKPEYEMRSKLKSNGFRWAPSKGCWQAYLNSRSIEKIGDILD